MTSKLNTKVLRSAISNTISNSKKIKEEIRVIASEEFRRSKLEMMEEFDNHPVTQEIKAGPESNNSSNTLGGYGNLYSFIGFREGQDPTSIVRDYLEQNSNLKRTVKFKKDGETDGVFYIQADIPSVSEIELITPSEWDTKSWVRGIERGMSGLGNYIYSMIQAFRDSRSGSAVQAQKKLRGLGYKPVKYISSIVNNFRNKVDKAIR